MNSPCSRAVPRKKLPARKAHRPVFFSSARAPSAARTPGPAKLAGRSRWRRYGSPSAHARSLRANKSVAQSIITDDIRLNTERPGAGRRCRQGLFTSKEPKQCSSRQDGPYLCWRPRWALAPCLPLHFVVPKACVNVYDALLTHRASCFVGRSGARADPWTRRRTCLPRARTCRHFPFE